MKIPLLLVLDASCLPELYVSTHCTGIASSGQFLPSPPCLVSSKVLVSHLHLHLTRTLRLAFASLAAASLFVKFLNNQRHSSWRPNLPSRLCLPHLPHHYLLLRPLKGSFFNSPPMSTSTHSSPFNSSIRPSDLAPPTPTLTPTITYL